MTEVLGQLMGLTMKDIMWAKIGDYMNGMIPIENLDANLELWKKKVAEIGTDFYTMPLNPEWVIM